MSSADLIALVIVIIIFIALIILFWKSASFFYSLQLDNNGIKNFGLVINVIGVLALLFIFFIDWEKHMTFLLLVLTLVSIINIYLFYKVKGLVPSGSSQDKENSLAGHNLFAAIVLLLVLLGVSQAPMPSRPSMKYLY